MTSSDRRLNALERIYQRPAAPDPAPPFDPSRLTEDERTELEAIGAVLAAADVGSTPLPRRADLRARLETLSDAQLERLQVLQLRACGRDEEAQKAEHMHRLMDDADREVRRQP